IAYILTIEKANLLLKILKSILNIYIYIFLSVPALVLIVFVYYGSFGFNFNSITSSIIALSLNLSPFAARIIESSIKNMEPEYIKTAYSFGYSDSEILRKIKLPIIFTNSFEPILVQWITTIKLSSLASVIGVSEILFQGNAIIAETYRTETTYVAVILSYALIILLFTKLTKVLSIKFFKKKIKIWRI
ncbi:MAG: ABC transporter permease subunit, partial [Bacteroidota bacterium]